MRHIYTKGILILAFFSAVLLASRVGYAQTLLQVSGHVDSPSSIIWARDSSGVYYLMGERDGGPFAREAERQIETVREVLALFQARKTLREMLSEA